MPKHSVVDSLEAIVVHNSNSISMFKVEIPFFLTQWLNHFMAWGFLGKDMLQGRLAAQRTVMVWATVGTHSTLIQNAIMELMLQE